MTNRPFDIKPISRELVLKYEPKSSWLSHDSEIHGVDHMARVFILQELICEKLENLGITVDREVTKWASMAHDVGRVDDGLDLEHGRRSAQWIKDHLSEKMSPELMDKVTYTVHWHVPSDNEAPVMTPELQVLKDADALDRVRLGDLDPTYLRTEVSPGLIGVAEYLYQSYLENKTDDDFGSVVKAAESLGLIEYEVSLDKRAL